MSFREQYDAMARQVRDWWISPGRRETYTARFRGTFEQAVLRAADASAYWKSKVYLHTDMTMQPIGPKGQLPAPIDYFGPLWATVSVPAASPLRGGPMTRPLAGTYENPRRLIVTAHNSAARRLLALMRRKLAARNARAARGWVVYSGGIRGRWVRVAGPFAPHEFPHPAGIVSEHATPEAAARAAERRARRFGYRLLPPLTRGARSNAERVVQPRLIAGSEVVYFRVDARGGAFARTRDGRLFYRRAGAARWSLWIAGRPGRAAYRGDRNPNGAERVRRAQELRARQAAIDRALREEVGALRPLGRMGEFAEALGVRPRRGVAVGTPFGTVVFAKTRAPTRQQAERWHAMYREIEGLRKQEIALSPGRLVIDPHRTIGNVKVLERLEELDAQGLLDADERAYMLRLRAFWRAHPTAKSGLVREDGSIEPLYR